MALYDGFFDAVPDGVHEDGSTKYDREYEAGDFTTYFGQIVGSGVCIYRNEDSYRVRMGDGSAIVSPGYLFINGYWLKNDADYTVPLDGGGIQAIVAHLNTGAKRIDLEARSAAQSYPDSLVLALVDTSSGTVEDTRYNADICGVIDAAGSVSSKIEWALNYIDTEIEAKLAQAEADIQAQSRKLDAKIAEVQAQVNKIVPPPVGSIKFSASQDVGPEWLRCDGSFINEQDYPELVAALGKLTPGLDSFSEILNAAQSEQISNHCIMDGTVWIYLVKSHKLVGLSSNGKKEISVTGVDRIIESPNIDVVLSICGGAVYLAQNNYSANAFALLEHVGFSDAETSISMSALDVQSQMDGLDGRYCYPIVVNSLGKQRMALGISFDKSYDKYSTITVVQWIAGNFAESEKATYDWKKSINLDGGGTVGQAKYKYHLSSLLAFNEKNSRELLFATHNINISSPNITIVFGIGSEVQKLYGDTDNTLYVRSDIYTGKYAMFYDPNFLPPLNILPIAANREYLYWADIVQRKLTIYYGKYSPKTIFDWKVIPIQLPARANLFKGSVVYANTQGVWFVFVGTGMLFTDSLTDGTWGYLDTTGFLGTITQFGYLDYDAQTNTLYISGSDTTGTPKVGKFALPDLYNYANDGAWLPMIASDGVPAYIKAGKAEGEP